MAHKYLNDDGGNSAPYESTTNAATTLSGLLAGTTVAVDEHIWVKSDHVDNGYTAHTTFSSHSGATPSSPQRLLSTSDWDASPTTLNSGAIIGTNGGYAITFEGCWYLDGLTLGLNAGTPDTTSTTRFGTRIGPSCVTAQDCTFQCDYTLTNAAYCLWLTTAVSTAVEVSVFTLLNPVFYPNVANTSLLFFYGSCTVAIDNMSFHASATAPNTLFRSGLGSNVKMAVTNSDLSGKAWTNLIEFPAAHGVVDLTLRNCKLPSGVTIVNSSAVGPYGTVRLINCDSGDTWTRHEEHSYQGVWSVITTVYADTDPALFKASEEYSIKMVSSANASRFLPLYSQWMPLWNDAAAYTPAIEVLVDGAVAALDNDELWLEVDYNSGSDSPLGTRVTTCPGLLETPASVADGTTTWTGDTGWDHKLSTAQITPDKPGFIWIRVALAKASTTIYVNPPRP